MIYFIVIFCLCLLKNACAGTRSPPVRTPSQIPTDSIAHGRLWQELCRGYALGQDVMEMNALHKRQHEAREGPAPTGRELVATITASEILQHSQVVKSMWKYINQPQKLPTCCFCDANLQKAPEEELRFSASLQLS